MHTDRRARDAHQLAYATTPNRGVHECV